MSAPSVVSDGTPTAASKISNGAATKQRRHHVAGGVTLGKENSREAQRLAAAILEVLAGVRTPGQAAAALGVSMPSYYHLETRALRGLLAGCEARPRGRVRSPDKELVTLKRQHERLQRELGRQQTLVRMAQRTVGLTPPPVPAPAAKGSKKRHRRPVVRALSAATHLQQQSQEAPGVTVVPKVEETAG
ncbi:MAG TPA: hypothetical protein VG013_09920 [Gemmataceae bacterium]|jgi:hypothetical protein|nr:hypothetical protein [Gemmataceae bacterium]